MLMAGVPFYLICWQCGFRRDCPEMCKALCRWLQSPHIVGNLKEVMVVESGVQALVQFVVGYGVKHLRIDPTAVVAVDYLAHKPEIFLHPCGFLPHLFHEI